MVGVLEHDDVAYGEYDRTTRTTMAYDGEYTDPFAAVRLAIGARVILLQGAPRSVENPANEKERLSAQ